MNIKDLKNAISDYGLIFAKGEKEDLLSDHGKVYCSFLLINFYFDEEKIFSFKDDLKTTQYFSKTTINDVEKESEVISDEKIKDSARKDKNILEVDVSDPKEEIKPQDSTVDDQPEAKVKEEIGVF